MLAEESLQAEPHQLTDAHVDSKILTLIRLHDNKDTWMVPLITLIGLFFVVYNKDYTKTTNDNMYIDDITAYIVNLWQNRKIRSYQFLTSYIIKLRLIRVITSTI